jgi:Viral BACON domain
LDCQVGTSSLAPASVSITNTGNGPLTFSGVSDQPWLAISSGSGTAPATLQILPSANGLAGTYTGQVRLTGGGTTKTVTVVLSITGLRRCNTQFRYRGRSQLAMSSAISCTARRSRVARMASWRAPSAGLLIPIRPRNPELLITTSLLRRNRG